MTEIHNGTKATCRYCGHEIIHEPWFRDGREPNEPVWSHIRSGTKSCSTRPVGWAADNWPFASPASRDGEEVAARTASGQQPESCRPIDVDGTTILVRGSGDWTDEDQHHMAAIVAAAKRRYEAEHPACSCTHPQDRHLSACTECPCVGYAPTWPRTAAPAAGQPAEAQAADLLAACATEYQVPVPEGGGTTLQVRRQSLVHGMGWAVSTRAYGGGRAWTTEGWQESISALSVDRLFCWPDAATAVTEARRALATVEEDETR
jgi:hypothetical protein